MYRRATELMEAELGDELVALDAERGECFGFNDIATVIWRNLERPKSFAQLRDVLLAEYDVAPGQCEAELRELLDDLLAKGLLATAEQDGTSSDSEHFS